MSPPTGSTPANCIGGGQVCCLQESCGSGFVPHRAAVAARALEVERGVFHPPARRLGAAGQWVAGRRRAERSLTPEG